MNKELLRNIAIVSGIFAFSISIMLCVSFIKMKSTVTLNAPALEMLKQINDQNPGNEVLLDQIRHIDLIVRNSYFASERHLHFGIYILVAMSLTLIISLRLLFKSYKNIPDKSRDSIDEWAIKTLSRRYVRYAGIIFVVVSTGVGVMSSYDYKAKIEAPVITETQETIDQGVETPENIITEVIEEETIVTDTTKVIPQEPAVEVIEVSKVTANGFRGNNSNGISTAKGIPTTWNLSDKTNILWSVDIPRKGYNSPIINGNRVFLTGADENARDLYCYDLTTGALLWTATADNISGSPSAMPKTTSDTGLAASTVSTNGKQVCAIFASGDLLCTDMEGKRLWAKNVGVPDNHYGYASSLLTYGNLLIIQYDNQSPKVMALNMATGAEVWSKARPDKIAWSSPIIANTGSRSELILMGNPSITSYNPANGEQYWRVECMSGEVASSPCSSSGIVFGASEYATAIAINAADGSTLWKANEYLPDISSPVAYRDNLFIVTGYGVAVCYDAKSGEKKKEHDLGGEFQSSPIVADGKIYLFDKSGKAYIFSANSEFNLLGSVSTGATTHASPAFTDNKMVVRSDKGLYCVAKK